MKDLFLLLGAIMGGVVIGGFCGAFPLVIGLIKKRKVLALVGMISCVIFGAICTTLLYIPAFVSALLAIVFVIAILLFKKNEKT